MKTKFPFRAIIALILCFTVIISVVTAYAFKNIYGAISPSLAKKLSQISNIVDSDYYFNTNDKEIEEAIASGYISGIGDKYAAYYSKDNATVVKNKYKGDTHGIGMLCVNTNNYQIYVWRVYSGGSAQIEGLKSGDVITAINGKSVTKTSYNDCVKLLQGKSGKKVNVTYLRNEKENTVTVTCGDYDVQSVYYNLINNKIGYIQIIDFNSKTYLQFKNAVEELKKQGAKSYIFDLRHNGGGTVDSAAKIIDYVLPKGDTIHVKNKSGEIVVRNRSNKSSLKAPIVVLADSKTASSAEIMISALKDFGAATIMGTKTYGKSLIQRNYALNDGSLIKLTIGEFVTAKGDSYNGIGLIPDIELKPSYSTDYEYYFLAPENDTMLISAINQLS